MPARAVHAASTSSTWHPATATARRSAAGYPAGVRIVTTCGLGDVDPSEVAARLEKSLDESLERMRLSFVDVFLLHHPVAAHVEPGQWATPTRVFTDAVRPAMEDLVRRGRIGAWGITAISEPDEVIAALRGEPKPAVAQCVTNLLDSPGELYTGGEPRSREILAAAEANGVGIMGIRAVQAGALTDDLDRELPDDHPTVVDFRRAAPFRTLARELGEPRRRSRTATRCRCRGWRPWCSA